jgi:hypothetical protein
LDVTLSDFVTRVHFDFFYNSCGPAGDSICDCRHKNRPGRHPGGKNKMKNKLLRIAVAMASDRSGVPGARYSRCPQRSNSPSMEGTEVSR